MINRVVLVGRLTKNPEFRTTPNGIGVTMFTLAVNRTFTNQNGERQADFINCVAFKNTAEAVNNYLQKGNLAGIEGRIQTRNYENNEGNRVYITEVVCDSVQFLEPKNTNQQNNNYRQSNYNQQQNYNQSQNYQPQNNQTYQGQQNKGNRSAYQPQQNYGYQNQQTQQPNPFSNSNAPIDIKDEDLPF